MGGGDGDTADETIDHMPDHFVIAILAVEAVEAVQGGAAERAERTRSPRALCWRTRVQWNCGPGVKLCTRFARGLVEIEA